MDRSNKTSPPLENTGDHDEIEKMKLDVEKANDLIFECLNINNIIVSVGISSLANVLGAMLRKYGTKHAYDKIIEFLIKTRDE